MSTIKGNTIVTMPRVTFDGVTFLGSVEVRSTGVVFRNCAIGSDRDHGIVPIPIKG